jgi:prepilin-type N-terminal cleavage/methylation domain-containing protein
MMKAIQNKSGVTLVEVMVSLLIVGILTCGLVLAYARGMEQFNKTTARYYMLAEGTAQLRRIESNIRQAFKLSINNSNDPIRSKITAYWGDKDGDGHPDGSIDYYVNSLDRTLRESDHRVGVNKLHRMILPITRVMSDRRDPLGTPPYQVSMFKLSDGDDLIPNYHPGVQPYILVIQLMLTDDLGDTVSLSSTVSRFNKAQ